MSKKETIILVNGAIQYQAIRQRYFFYTAKEDLSACGSHQQITREHEPAEHP
ncbi:hypothetical protein [Schaalia cardiffensis]|uniref:hypothetical protein n=1 Tax=Schaalia cardiffensis TaxID=181487 RepID=UPI002AB16435|nr:hypothetical protein [Schaalia cardiffensis]